MSLLGAVKLCALTDYYRRDMCYAVWHLVGLSCSLLCILQCCCACMCWCFCWSSPAHSLLTQQGFWRDHQLVLILQSLKHEDAENIGYVIPTPVIEHFISDYARTGQYTAFPSLGIEWQKMESPFMRKALGMKVDPASHTAAIMHPPSGLKGPVL